MQKVELNEEIGSSDENGTSSRASGQVVEKEVNQFSLYKSLYRVRGAAEVLTDLAEGGPRGVHILREGGLSFLASVIEEETAFLMRASHQLFDEQRGPHTAT